MPDDVDVPNSSTPEVTVIRPIKMHIEAIRCHNAPGVVSTHGTDKVSRMSEKALAELGNLGYPAFNCRVESASPMVNVRVELTSSESELLTTRLNRLRIKSRVMRRMQLLRARLCCKSDVITLEMKILAEHWHFVQSTMVCVEQEKTQRIAIASCPLQSRITRLLNNSDLNGERHALDAYRWGLHLVAAANADARVYCDWTPEIPEGEEDVPETFVCPPANSNWYVRPVVSRDNVRTTGTLEWLGGAESKGPAGRGRTVNTQSSSGGYDVTEFMEAALERDIGVQESAHLTTVANRVTTAEPRELRDGVKVRPYTSDEILDNIERGILPPSANCHADENVHRRDCVWTGPRIADVTPALDPNSHKNERMCLSRHLSKKTKIAPEQDAINRQKKAYDIMREAISKRFERALYFPEAALPKKWSDGMKELAAERMSEDGRLKLQGFVKPKEIGLPEDKLPRGIGNPGTDAAARWASRVSVFEQMFCALYPNFMMKGLTQDEQDAKIASMIQSDPKMEWCSIDFAAMDSSWTLKEKQMIVNLVRDLSQMFVSSRDAYVGMVDPSDFDKVHWFFKTLSVVVPQEHCILYSGERGTSIFNRLLVLLLRTAEIIRKLGVAAAIDFWEARWHDDDLPAYNYDVGDGDDEGFNNVVDTLHGPKKMYMDVNDVIASYRKYGKTVEPVLAVGRIEILSRFTMVTPGKNPKVIHLVKMPKNLQRLVMSTVETFQLVEADSAFTISSHMHALFATTALTRAVAAKYTMGLRWLALAIGVYHMSRAHPDEMMQFSDKWEAEQWKVTSLQDFYWYAVQELTNVETSSYSMVEWTHFGGIMPGARELKELKIEWRAFDDSARQVEITEDDMNVPELIFERLDLSRRVARCVGISPKLLTCCGVGVLAKRVPETEPGLPELAAKKDFSDSLDEVGATAKATGHDPNMPSSITGQSAFNKDAPHFVPSSDGATTSGLAARGNTVGVATVDAKSSTTERGGDPASRPELKCYHCGDPHKIADCPTAPKTKGKGKGKGKSGGNKGKGKGKQSQRPGR